MSNLSDAPESWPVTRSVQAFTGALIGVRRDTLVGDGETFDREVVTHPGAVCIVAVDEDDRVLVITQYRHAAGERLVELPAGLLDVEDEPPLEAAKRELREEAQIEATRWTPLFSMLTTPGASDEVVHFYVAEQVSDVGLDGQFTAEHEEATMTRQWVPLEDLVDAVMAGRAKDSLTVAGSLALWRLRHG